jgi:16S rRNA (guanine966-N2)-methyltransferase
MKNGKSGAVRIIGGEWRGRKLPVPDLPGLRPSGDRSRETLFNWLQPVIRGARCVDLFAGTGALGLEAASRGAAGVILLEKSRVAARAIADSVVMLRAKNVRVELADAIDWLQRADAESLDIVFVDPPFGAGLEMKAMDLLLERNSLSENGLVYVESDLREQLEIPGPGWRIQRETALGDVKMRLLKKI